MKFCIFILGTLYLTSALANPTLNNSANFILVESTFWDNIITELQGWVLANNMNGNLISICNGKSLIGGYGSLGLGATATKKFTLPLHQRLRLIVTIYIVDSWDDHDLIIKFDGVEVWKRRYHYGTAVANICGWSSYNEQIVYVDEIIVHTKQQLEIQMLSTVDQRADNESWGFRDFTLFIEPRDDCTVLFTQANSEGSQVINLPQLELISDSQNAIKIGNCQEGYDIKSKSRSLKLKMISNGLFYIENTGTVEIEISQKAQGYIKSDQKVIVNILQQSPVNIIHNGLNEQLQKDYGNIYIYSPELTVNYANNVL